MHALLALALLTGLASSYGGPAHVGQPLYCDRGTGLVYDQATPSWAAVDVDAYRNRHIQCGDLLAVRFADGTVLHAQALDAGYLAPHGIVVDVPFHLAPFSVETGVVPVAVIDYSLLRRTLE